MIHDEKKKQNKFIPLDQVSKDIPRLRSIPDMFYFCAESRVRGTKQGVPSITVIC